MKLVKYEGYNLTFEPELLNIKVFKKLHQRDKTKDKSKFLQELGYIYFFVDPRSDFQIYTDEDDRHKEILESMGLPNDWKVDKEIKDAMNYYSGFKPISALLLDDTRVAVNKLRTMLRNIDLEQVDDKGKPIYTLNTIVATIKQVPSLVRDLDEAERTIAKEIIQNDKVRGSAEKAMYEDMIM